MSAAATNVVLILRPDGTFDQTVSLSGQTINQSGTWRIDHNHLILVDTLVEFRGWHPSTEQWPIIDRNESPTGFAIFGGDVDPDLWIVFDWIP